MNTVTNPQNHFSKIYRCTRKISNMSQKNFSDMLSIPTAQLKEIESDLTTPSASMIFQFCDATGISVESFKKGYIDRPFAKNHNDSTGNGFDIPEKYLQHNYSSIRYLNPFIKYMELFGTQELSEYHKSKEIDPDYFVSWDNRLNLNYTVEMLQEMLETNPESDGITEFIAGQSCSPETHGHLADTYMSCQSPTDIIDSYINNIDSYDRNFSYQIENKTNSTIDFSIEEKPHIQDILREKRDFFLDFSHEFNKKYLQNMPKLTTAKETIISSSQETKGDIIRWIYRVAA